MIEVKHLDKSFGDLHILKDISTNIEKGEKVVIIGPVSYTHLTLPTILRV